MNDRHPINAPAERSGEIRSAGAGTPQENSSGPLSAPRSADFAGAEESPSVPASGRSDDGPIRQRSARGKSPHAVASCPDVSSRRDDASSGPCDKPAPTERTALPDGSTSPEQHGVLSSSAASGAPRTRREAVRCIADPLVPLYGEWEARQIALTVVSEVARLSPAALLADPAAPLPADGLERIAAELAAGRPMQYVLGHTEFCGLRIGVQEGVLIPRPETEELAAWIAESNPQARRILDVGTGSGCIALALKHLLPEAEVWAADLSEEALAVARANAAALGLDVRFQRADALRKAESSGPWGNNASAGTGTSQDARRYPAERPAATAGSSDTPAAADAPALAEAFGGRFGVIVSNPPYIPQAERAAMRRNVTEHEPGMALFVPDADPLRFYRSIARAGRRMLAPHGRLYFEIHERLAAETRSLLAAEGYAQIELRHDFNDKPRMLCARIKS